MKDVPNCVRHALILLSVLHAMKDSQLQTELVCRVYLHADHVQAQLLEFVWDVDQDFISAVTINV